MDAVIGPLFLARLRSGQDVQTRGCLNRTRPGTTQGSEDPDEIHPAGLCCLGVLSEMAADAGIVERVIDEERGQIGYTVKGYKRADEEEDHVAWGILHPAVVAWAGLPSGDPLIALPADAKEAAGLAGGETLSMAGLNDTLRWTFPVIADRVAAQL
jgi:hypothetical protein